MPEPGVDPADRALAEVLDRNITALLERRRREAEQAPTQLRVADAITHFTGSMHFIYLHLLLFGGWIVVNLGWVPGVLRFDPSFVVLAMVASVEAIFLSTFVLISQNRMADAADRRADLDLQINLLAEHEITRLATLIAAMAEKLGVEVSDVEFGAVQRDVRPEEVLDELERRRED